MSQDMAQGSQSDNLPEGGGYFSAPRIYLVGLDQLRSLQAG